MLGRGYLYALRPGEARVMEASSSARDVRVLLEVLRTAGARIAELDKAWLPIHRALALGERDGVLSRAVLGGQVVTDGEGLVATLVSAVEVEAVARALEALTEDDFRDRYAACLDGEPDGETEELDLLYAWGWFQRLRAHYGAAASAGDAVLFAAQVWPADERRGAAA
jgi:hypothetical protein